MRGGPRSVPAARRAAGERRLTGAPGGVTWVATDEALRAAVDQAAAGGVYAFDTEFHRERTYWPHLALLQLAWPSAGGVRIALVDPLAVDLAPLVRLFDSDALAVAHAASQDLEVLDRAVGAVPRALFDTQLAAGFVGFSSPSLASLADKLCGVTLAKGDRLTDWTRRPLTESQQAYAADDVAHLLDIRDRLLARLRRTGREAWAEQEFAELLARPRTAQDPDTAWWRIKEARALRGQARAIAQAVAAWRERRAQALDRPVRQVMPDLGVVGIAHRAPTDPGGLRSIRGLEGRAPSGKAAEEVLAAVRAGKALPRAALRLPPVDELDRDLRPAVTLVSAWVSQLGRDLGVETALLATRSDLQALLRGDPDARLSHGWRAELVGEPVRRLVAGEAALAFRPGSGDLELVDHR